MPEGHTIHRLAQDLTASLEGSRLKVSSPQGRFDDAVLLDGRVLTQAVAIGKHLFLFFGTLCVHIHLGLFGRFRLQPAPFMPPRGAVRLRLESDRVCWNLAGPTVCECIDDEAFAALKARLGADPLSTDARPKGAWNKFNRSKRAVGAALLDQRLFAGIGNVYRAELLFLTRLHPATRCCDIDKPTFEKLWRLAVKLLRQGVKYKRIVTVAGATKSAPKRESVYVYKRRLCRVCETAIDQLSSANRTIYFCPHCQRPQTLPKPPVRARRQKERLAQ
jgi:endonuclease VIII